MLNDFSCWTRRSLILAASLAIGAGTFFSLNVRADDSKLETGTISTLSADDHQLMMAEVEKISAMAANPKQAEKLKKDMGGTLLDKR
jgi:hypothetical protein